ncbi:MAG: HTH domain-containing protein, partial [Candidatus Zixiibacteriota bacterium]
MPKSDRLLYILNLLRTRRNLNAARLAEECGVTERSIYRDIISLSEAN